MCDISSLLISGQIIGDIEEKETAIPALTFKLKTVLINGKTKIESHYKVLAVKKAALAIKELEIEQGNKILISAGSLYIKDDEIVVRIEHAYQITKMKEDKEEKVLNEGVINVSEKFI